MIPSRETYWNISHYYLAYLFFLVMLIISGRGVYRHVKALLKARGENRFDHPIIRIRSAITLILRMRGRHTYRWAAMSHSLIFFGAIVLFIGTVSVFIHTDFIPFLYGSTYLYFSLILDIFGLLAILGTIGLIINCYVKKRPIRLLVFFLSVLATGFIVEGLRIGAAAPIWGIWSVIGWSFAGLLNISGLSKEYQALLHPPAWWIHAVLSFTFLAYIPFTRLFHIIASPFNIYSRELGRHGVLSYMDLENSERFGIAGVSDLTWKQILDAETCVECGRCEEHCPAAVSGKALTPKKIIGDFKKIVSDIRDDELIEGHIREEEIWACTTCFACHRQCPLFIEVIDKIVGMRRKLVLEDSKYPAELKTLFKNLETNGNPWGIGYVSRGDWAKRHNVKTMEERGGADLLYWVGCAASFDNRNKKIAAAVVSILNKAGIDFAILGAEERCTGDSARRLGNEYLFQMLAVQNIETLKKYNVKRIVTACPHCFNTLKNEYPQFGGDYEVIHHSQLFAELNLSLPDLQQKITYHDPCYLGRHNHIFQEPRSIIDPEGRILMEMDRSRCQSFCCGAGGGRMWMEEKTGRRINEIRVEEALSLNPSIIATACPFCLTMMEDGVKLRKAEEQVKVMDISEILSI